jgi:FtsP/CotA-like multicopper oxidase with cupredoxin domain
MRPIELSRREFLKAGAAGVACAALPSLARAAAGPSRLLVGPVDKPLYAGEPAVRMWGFNEQIPGPVLRFRKGETARLVVRNGLETDTAVHWHGVRVPNAMDGVPFVTQEPIKPGEEFAYEYKLRDSGTFWYHPHQSAYEQVPRGLYGALIVEEDAPIEVDRELVFALSDVKLGADGQLVEDFGRILDLANEGRIGNQVLVNGQPAGGRLEVRSGERIRLRILNTASARIFRLALTGHVMNVVAYDGQAVEPHAVERLDLGPGMRADLVVDFLHAPEAAFSIVDFDRRAIGTIMKIAYAAAPPLRERALAAPMALAANDLPEPDLAQATDHYIVFQGGMRGSSVIGMVDGKPAKIHEIMEKQGLAWTMNYTAQHEHAMMHEPLLTLAAGEHVVLHMVNETDFAHPMHLHGHFFRVIARNGQKTKYREWRDTVLMAPRETVDVAFVADNIGEWMFHCHILDHAAGGMMGTIAVG